MLDSLQLPESCQTLNAVLCRIYEEWRFWRAGGAFRNDNRARWAAGRYKERVGYRQMLSALDESPVWPRAPLRRFVYSPRHAGEEQGHQLAVTDSSSIDRAEITEVYHARPCVEVKRHALPLTLFIDAGLAGQ